jgi:uncharacterized OsmC-like protein
MDGKINGVDVCKMAETVKLIEQYPDLSAFSFRADSSWVSGGHSKIKIHRFYGAGAEDESRPEPFELEVDEPGVLLGTNQSANPVELVLAAVVSCLTVGFSYNAAARGITIESLNFHAEGDLDIRGFLGISDDSRPGYFNIKLVCNIKSDASDEQLQELSEFVQKTSPVMDIVRNVSPISLRVET